MRVKTVLLIAILFITTNSYAQNNCSCTEALEKLINKIESEYPGFEEKTKDKILYNSFKKQLKEEAINTEQNKCFDVLKKYTSFFRDGHIIWLNATTSLKTGDVKNKKVADVNIDQFEKKISKSKDRLEGIWKNTYERLGADFSYEIGIMKANKNGYIGFVIKPGSKLWETKEIKFQLFSDSTYEYHLKDHTVQKGKYTFYNGEVLSFEGIKSFFVKEGLTSEPSKDKITELAGFGFKRLTDKTSLLTLPSFEYSFVEIVERLLDKHKDLLENSEYLIVDVRNNHGGTDNCYTKLLPYIMTNSIRSLGAEYLATQTLIDGLQGYIMSIKDQNEKQNEVDKYTRQIDLFKKNMGKFVNVDKEDVSIWEITIAKKSPKNIVVLANKMVGSSGENFVMFAKESKKVKILGTPTYGGLDYASARIFDFGCPEYQLLLPTYRSLRLPDYPIDNIGLQPDIYLDKYVGDWIQFALDYLEKNIVQQRSLLHNTDF